MYREGIIIVMMAAKSGTRKFLATDQNVPGGSTLILVDCILLYPIIATIIHPDMSHRRFLPFSLQIITRHPCVIYYQGITNIRVHQDNQLGLVLFVVVPIFDCIVCIDDSMKNNKESWKQTMQSKIGTTTIKKNHANYQFTRIFVIP